MNPISVAVHGKGPLNTLKRIGVIGRRYGFTPSKMDRVLAHFADVLDQFDCDATFLITGVALARSQGVIERYQGRNIEFAVHGYYHVDHACLSLEQQLVHLAKARRLFDERGVKCQGFRCPYLRWSEDTIAALRRSGFLYDSSQSLDWPVVDGVHSDAYRQALDFYGALSASERPALPRIEDGLVEIPYSLPDDEALVERFHSSDDETMSRPWRTILEETYRSGELFTLGLHPERFFLCEQSFKELLRAARSLSPRVWVTRLEQVARWWTARTMAEVVVGSDGAGGFTLRTRGPEGLTILARGVDAVSPAVAWDDAYQRAVGSSFQFRAVRRPFIGVSPSSDPNLVSFLRQQGYIVEQTVDGRDHTYFLDKQRFGREGEREMLAYIERSGLPLVRLGRWPNGARSALCVTGDIDALTIWDYNLRFFGN